MKRCYSCMKEYEQHNESCPFCGYKNGTETKEHYYLPEGTELENRYIIGRVLGHGGFGITYIGYDKKFGITVAIKEYLPSDISTRALGETTVTTFSGEKHDAYVYGLGRFIDEAKVLVQYNNHPCIVSINDFFEQNNTAYLVMEYLDGITLSEYLKESSGRISEAETLSIIRPVIDALREVHSADMIHRDVSPDNIYVTKKAQIKLLDFGAARYAMSEKSKSLSVVLKPGFAPPEQYYSRGNQGPWTDIYAVAATMYRMLSGINPPEAMERVVDERGSVSNMPGSVSTNTKEVILKALSIKPEDRYQNMGEFYSALYEQAAEQDVTKVTEEIRVPEPEQIPSPVIASSARSTEKPEKPTKEKSGWSELEKSAKALIIFGCLVALFLILIAVGVFAPKPQTVDKDAANVVEEAQSEAPVEAPAEAEEEQPLLADDEYDILFFLSPSFDQHITEITTLGDELSSEYGVNIEYIVEHDWGVLKERFDILLITGDYDCIIADLWYYEGIEDKIRYANDWGTEIINIFSINEADLFTAQMGFNDTYQSGFILADSLCYLTGEKGQAVAILGFAENDISGQYQRGLETGLNANSVELVDVAFTEYNHELAYEATIKYLSSVQDLKYILCLNEDIVSGAVRAVEEMGRGDVYIGTLAWNKDNLEMYDNIYLAALPDISTLIKKSLTTAVKALNGEDFEKEQLIKNYLIDKNGNYYYFNE